VHFEKQGNATLKIPIDSIGQRVGTRIKLSLRKRRTAYEKWYAIAAVWCQAV